LLLSWEPKNSPERGVITSRNFFNSSGIHVADFMGSKSLLKNLPFPSISPIKLAESAARLYIYYWLKWNELIAYIRGDQNEPPFLNSSWIPIFG
jgi:hypothetical protein